LDEWLHGSSFLSPLLTFFDGGSEEAKNWRGTGLRLIQIRFAVESGENPARGSSTIDLELLCLSVLLAPVYQLRGRLSHIEQITDLLNSRLLLFEL
jgi:hypothetical protein